MFERYKASFPPPPAQTKKKLTFKEWEEKSGVYYHIAHKDGDWSMEKALRECWKAAQENK